MKKKLDDQTNLDTQMQQCQEKYKKVLEDLDESQKTLIQKKSAFEELQQIKEDKLKKL
jgi:hypothetical protein